MLAGSQEKRGAFKSKEDLKTEFIERARDVHGNKYDYSNFDYLKSNIKGKIFCSEHGEFWQTPSNHLRGTKCQICSCKNRKESTFKKKCNELGVDYWRALKRREAGLPEEKIFEEGYVRNSRKIGEIKVFGVNYPNLEEAVRRLNPPASSHTIGRWIREGMTPEEAFERIPNPGYANGVIYLITHTASGKQYVGLTIQTLERRWKYHVEQALAGYIKGDESLHYAIRQYGLDAFEIRQIDQGISKENLENKEKQWIKKLRTLVPFGYNISSGGVSGGSNKKTTYIDGIYFESVEKAAEYLSATRNISLCAAKKRISQGRVDVKTLAKPGESLIKTKAYKTWSRIIHGALNPKSKEYIPGLEIYAPWRNFENFLQDVGNPPEQGIAFSRLDKDKGFFPDNCAWLTKSESSKINVNYMKQKGKLGRKKSIKKVY
jgi:predicted GIY-YIG superfamily endonuclease